MSKPDVSKFRDRMDKAVAALKDEFGGLRTGRASGGLLEPVMVEAYGSTMPFSSVGSINVPEPRMITVSVWDKAMVIPVDKAIRNAGLGLNPITDGTTMRVPVPPADRGAAQGLGQAGRQIRRAAEGGRAQRAARRHGGPEEAEKDGAASARTSRRSAGEEVQGFTDEAVKRIDEALKTKEQEIMQV